MDMERIEVLGEKMESVSRRFVRSAEANPVGQIDGFKLIHGEEACTGCRNTVLSALIDMKNSDQLMYLPGVTVLVGGAEVPAGEESGDIVTVGSQCFSKENRGDRHATGCPPNNVDVVQAIIGARAKVKRMYADQSDPESSNAESSELSPES